MSRLAHVRAPANTEVLLGLCLFLAPSRILLIAAVCGMPALADGQSPPSADPGAHAEYRAPRSAPRVRWGMVLGMGTAWAEDEAGVRVRSGVIAGLSAEAGWAVGEPYTLGLGVRATTAGVSIEEHGDSRSAGRASQADVIGSLERAVGDRIVLRLGAGAAWTRGPSDVVPFRYGNNGQLQPTSEVGALMRLTSGRPLFASLALQSFRFGGATVGDPIREPGWVNRALFGIRHGR